MVGDKNAEEKVHHQFTNKVSKRAGITSLNRQELRLIRDYVGHDFADTHDVVLWRTLIIERTKSLGNLVKGKLGREDVRISCSRFPHKLEVRDNYWITYNSKQAETGESGGEPDWKFGAVRSYVTIKNREDPTDISFLVLVDTLTDIRTFTIGGTSFVYTSRVSHEKRSTRLVVMDSECIIEQVGLVQSGKRSFIIGKEWVRWSGTEFDSFEDLPQKPASDYTKSPHRSTSKLSQSQDADSHKRDNVRPSHSQSQVVDSHGRENVRRSQSRVNSSMQSVACERENLRQSPGVDRSQSQRASRASATVPDIVPNLAPNEDMGAHWTSEDEYFN
ncbi:hypothetical protein BJ508DRAFT_314453 [Ascobolus immersus RN42]|uniref:Uncharacterized protein n=1 Tax=Ascobolus immersus RN42 TaxID=1160509 RepID=A0A3N4HLK0_ASCIM|nr:hypothetical protein BJ508DRAFT_314453 [Ascobolus immersus RN42]